ncbi:hypothetical protein [Phaffia rhodozyma]|uniref:MARVEL domain-containing protein n=1 Tax=Phaffia rhodozyma TaxID=264483 RepID=A0A0F7SFC0_PHARH|nr:hypothetical protein [Phaffia rhodozyma]CDZ97466.1 hypothetical protein [Phaffia rhodozyma]CED83524.1 hypothetical protein [Phaffia rhodozyma]
MPSHKAEIRLINIIHAIQFVLTVAVLAIGLVKMFIIKPRTSSSRWLLSVSAKSLITLAYIVLSENVSYFHRWASLKANMILNILEAVFWIAAIVLTTMGLINGGCAAGVGCGTTYAAIAIGSLLAALALPMAYLSIKHFMNRNKNQYQINDDSSSDGSTPMITKNYGHQVVVNPTYANHPSRV